MPYELFWRNRDSEGWTDHLPDRFFAGSQRDSAHRHRCTKAGRGTLFAQCILNSDDGFLYIFYPPQENLYSGTTRIPLHDGRPRAGDEVTWADPGVQSFSWDAAEWGEPPLLKEAAPDAEERLERDALTRIRIGQDEFRRGLDEAWSSTCALTGVTQRAALRASHITPWRNAEGRLDPENGLLLAAHVDALFDGRLITFDSAGALHWSPEVSPIDRDRLGLPSKLTRAPTAGEDRFLHQHRLACDWFTTEDR